LLLLCHAGTNRIHGIVRQQRSYRAAAQAGVAVVLFDAARLAVAGAAQVSLAYLLARAADTIADTKAVARGKRILCLREFQSLTRVPNLGAIADNQGLKRRCRVTSSRSAS
jgi:hypothetical protein